MCGIVGYIGEKKAKKVVINGLKKLEYRGYDSAGLSFFDDKYNSFEVFKETGRVSELKKLLNNNLESNIAIGHTRWATHGKVTKDNAHPHVSRSGRFIIVHNGVIENSDQLYQQYVPDYELKSDTDSEIIAHLIETFSKEFSVDNAIVTALKLLEGSYALLIIDKETPEIIYAAKNKSPLLIGLSKDQGTTIASDLLALSGFSENYIPLFDHSFAICEKSKINVFNFELELLKPDIYKVSDDISNSHKGDFDHYMIKEIQEQPKVIKRILKEYEIDNDLNIEKRIIDDIKKSDRIYIVAAGTSMHAGLLGKRYIERFSQIPVEVYVASEFAYELPIFSNKPYFIFITQSGETADLRASLKSIEKLNFPILTITNVKTSTLARESSYYLDVKAGPEIAVASTKAYVAQSVILLILAYSLSNKEYDIKKNLIKLADSMELFIKSQHLEQISIDFLKKRNAFFIGRGTGYLLSLEAALKLKEISYIQTEGFAAGELKHGTIALIEEETPVFAIITEKNKEQLTRSNLKEVEARGAKTCVITIQSLSKKGDEIILGDVDEITAPLLLVLPVQLLSYYAALQRGFDIDKPRNLAKSVTVE